MKLSPLHGGVALDPAPVPGARFPTRRCYSAENKLTQELMLPDRKPSLDRLVRSAGSNGPDNG